MLAQLALSHSYSSGKKGGKTLHESMFFVHLSESKFAITITYNAETASLCANICYKRGSQRLVRVDKHCGGVRFVYAVLWFVWINAK